MSRILFDEVRLSKKQHHCDGWDNVDNHGIYLTYMEKYKCDGIKPKQKYINCVHIRDHELVNYKSCLDCEEYIRKYEIEYIE